MTRRLVFRLMRTLPVDRRHGGADAVVGGGIATGLGQCHIASLDVLHPAGGKSARLDHSGNGRGRTPPWPVSNQRLALTFRCILDDSGQVDQPVTIFDARMFVFTAGVRF